MDPFDFTEEKKNKFLEDGYLVIEDFYSPETCDRLRQECSRLIDDMNPADHRTVFSTQDHEQMKEDYFLTSGDKIRYFWEAEATDDNGELNRPKHKALNKIGHEFERATFTPALDAILRKLHFKKPAVPQSMYIFKQPHIGGNVTKHIDATFLESTPSKLTGFWIALEDATLENGCLHFAPGSHRDAEVTYRMVRNPDKDSKQTLLFEGEFRALGDERFVPVPVKKGSMIIIDGKVQHMSAKNVSDKSRHIYTFHVTETHESEWSQRNWLQPHTPFPLVYERTAR